MIEGKVLPLVTAFNGLEALRTPTQPYIFQNHPKEEALQIARDLVQSLYKYGGIGIAANQLGLPWSIFAMKGFESDIVCFNPMIAMPSQDTIKLEEGCLSFPGMTFKINRWRHVRVRFSDYEGFTDSFEYSGLTARTFLHELEHLEGKFFFEGVNRIHLERAIRQAKRNGHDYTSMGLMRYCRREE